MRADPGAAGFPDRYDGGPSRYLENDRRHASLELLSRLAQALLLAPDKLFSLADRLGPAKEVLQIGAVIGNEFSFELLHTVHPIPDEELQVALHCATDAELLYARGIPPEATYQFKHALIRDAAMKRCSEAGGKNCI